MNYFWLYQLNYKKYLYLIICQRNPREARPNNDDDDDDDEAYLGGGSCFIM